MILCLPFGVQGAVFSLLESSYGVDILDEWGLRPRLAEFPVVVAPEQDRMSGDMVADLKRYVTAGGRLSYAREVEIIDKAIARMQDAL